MAKCGRSGTRGDGKSASLYSPASLCVAPWHNSDTINAITPKHSADTFVCTCFFFSPYVRCCKEKFVTASFLEWQSAASRWESGRWSLLFCRLLPHFSTTVNCSDPHLYPTVWNIWWCCINNAVTPERFPLSPFFPVSPQRARAWWGPGGGGRTLALWSSLFMSIAWPQLQNMLTTCFTIHSRVSSQHNIFIIRLIFMCYRYIQSSLVIWTWLKDSCMFVKPTPRTCNVAVFVLS